MLPTYLPLAIGPVLTTVLIVFALRAASWPLLAGVETLRQYYMPMLRAARAGRRPSGYEVLQKPYFHGPDNLQVPTQNPSVCC